VLLLLFYFFNILQARGFVVRERERERNLEIYSERADWRERGREGEGERD